MLSPEDVAKYAIMVSNANLLKAKAVFVFAPREKNLSERMKTFTFDLEVDKLFLVVDLETIDQVRRIMMREIKLPINEIEEIRIDFDKGSVRYCEFFASLFNTLERDNDKTTWLYLDVILDR